MRKTMLMAALAAAISLSAPAQGPAGDAARGKAIYMKNMCDSCHGSAGHGSRYGPRLTPPFPWAAFAQQTRHPRESMPRYAVEFVSDQDLADIHAYLSSIKPGPKASDIPLLKNPAQDRPPA
jgi:mono/diheme cytochrome c family protein